MPAFPSPSPRPLTDAEYQWLDDFLIDNEAVIGNLEMLDGYLTALIIGPELVLPSRYLPYILGEGEGEHAAFATLEEAQRVLGLLTRHWNQIVMTLARGGPLEPMLIEDEAGSPGCDWARGFLNALQLTRTAWDPFLNDVQLAPAIFPILLLAHEHDPDPELRSQTIAPERRDPILIEMCEGVLDMYEHFLRQRMALGTTVPRRPRAAKKGGGRRRR